MPRVNRAIELLEQGQPLYYTGAGELTYENGVEMAQTWADYLMVEMEHYAFNIPGLSAFMRGLIAGGPTRSGHRTPTVIATLPTDGTSEEVMRANAWMVKHLLTAGRTRSLAVPRRDTGGSPGICRVGALPIPEHWRG